MKILRDTWLVYQRQLLIVIRTPSWLVIGLVQPFVYLLLFAPLLKVALTPMGATSYHDAYRIYVPGLLAALAIFGGLAAGFPLLGELRMGVIERFRVTPVSRLALLLGRALRETTTLLAQAVVTVIIALIFGLTVNPGYLLLAFILFTLMSLMSAAIAYAMTMAVRNDGALGPLVNTVSQPVALLSGVLLPIVLAPLWLRDTALWNPFYWAVAGMRALFQGNASDNTIWIGLIIMVVLTTAAVTWSARLFSSRVS
ncbi:MAG TPA: ABC transporter permease [Actinocrinis sp.]|uniref:ABC transporter permease n=1 Tax=Actinocrinis sp. TaxID=1920516 RepID=UPI002DDD887C|nr:ABC transporter permease [Actinocrinis sp.]HEV2343399.1 ABC transporter permease [Actinocrinis sp.]